MSYVVIEAVTTLHLKLHLNITEFNIPLAELNTFQAEKYGTLQTETPCLFLVIPNSIFSSFVVYLAETREKQQVYTLCKQPVRKNETPAGSCEGMRS